MQSIKRTVTADNTQARWELWSEVCVWRGNRVLQSKMSGRQVILSGNRWVSMTDSLINQYDKPKH